MFKLRTTLQLMDGIAICKMNAFENQWCVYEHWIEGPQGDALIYVGCCKLVDVFNHPDAIRNSAWRAMYMSDITLKVKIVALSPLKFDCAMHQAELIRNHRPFCNVTGENNTGTTTVITCNETGASWESQTQCAMAEGISQSALSNHLNGRVGCKSIKGKTYRRGT